MEELVSTLKKLTETHGPSGSEDRVRDLLIDDIRNYCDELYVDKRGNLVAVLKGKKQNRKVLVEAHMDEVGLVVEHIDDKGLISFEKIGWVDDRVLPSREVVVLTSKGDVHGIIGLKGKHLLSAEEISKPLNHREMKIDLGTSSKEETLNMGVEVGCCIAFGTPFRYMANHNLVSAKALDNRMGCTILVQTIKNLSRDFDYEFSVYVVGTVQEEIGAKGAATASFDIRPDIAICVDTLPFDDVADKPTHAKLAGGPSIRFFDLHEETLMGTVSNKWLTQKMITVAKEGNIPYQTDIFKGTFLDSSTLHLTGSGIPTASMVIPRRYAHSPCEVAALSDIGNGLKLLVSTIQSLNKEDFIQCGEKRVK